MEVNRNEVRAQIEAQLEDAKKAGCNENKGMFNPSIVDIMLKS